MSNRHHADTTSRIRDALDHQADNLDEKTLSRLAGLRREVLDEKKPVPAYGWIAAGGFAAAGLLALMLFFFQQNGAPASGELLEDLELLSSSDDPEFYMDIAFYEWLDKEYPDAG